jgi:hypothetical protein
MNLNRDFGVSLAVVLLLQGVIFIPGGRGTALAQPSPPPSPPLVPPSPRPPPCFIATAAYGAPWNHNVVTLRRFRDRYLMGNPAGNAFVRFYCAYSPPIARTISERPWAKCCVRIALMPAVVLAGAALGRPVDIVIVALLLAAGFCLLRRHIKKRRKGPAPTIPPAGPS